LILIKEKMKNIAYTDKKGYKREKPSHSNLIHRQNAFKYIYLKNRDKYPLRFRYYQVHHKDGNKKNNHSSNLELLTREQHEAIHSIKTKEVPRSNNTMKTIVIVGVIFLLAIIILFTFSRSDSNSGYICSYDAYNCADFITRAEAQAVMIYCGNDDIHYLDGDDDGIACEALP